MTTEISTRGEDLPRDQKTGLILPLTRSLGSQALAKHRALIGVELEVIAKKFDRFGWDRDRGTAAHDRLMSDWMEALQDYTLSEIRLACRDCVLDNPNRMPNEGHVLKAIMARRRNALALLPAKQKKTEPRKTPTPEDIQRRKSIMEEIGFKPKKFGGK